MVVKCTMVCMHITNVYIQGYKHMYQFRNTNLQSWALYYGQGGKEKGRPMRCPNEHWLNSDERENRLCTLTMSFKLLVHEGTHPWN
jgi:hypothetical protein